ncbi:hypothetical protein [Sorangium sp. So ce117]|uniref:hypothetical protein n=1 Tax=Sorangium sp. So ce117 TaxID=3133277 RepID=UPI003F6030C3
MLGFAALAGKASGQAPAGPCPWGRDRATLKCLPEPARPPPPPPTLVLDSSPTGAEVYRIPAALEGCESAQERSLGKTPLTLTPKSGLRSGTQKFCLKAAGFGPTPVSVNVAPSGLTRQPPIMLARLVRVQFVWDPACAYHGQPEWILVTPEPSNAKIEPWKAPFPPDPMSLSQGDHRFVVAADGFEKKEITVPVGQPGGPDLHAPICLEPATRITIRNREKKHPLDGLFIQLVNRDGLVLWSGKAPVGPKAIDVPARPRDVADIWVFADGGYTQRVPEKHARREPQRAGKADKSDKMTKAPTQWEVWLDLQSGDEGIDMDRTRMTAECLDSESSDGSHCASEAYLRVHKDHVAPLDADVKKLIEVGCRKNDLASCVAMPVLDADDLQRLDTQCQQNADAATTSSPVSDASLTWLACVRRRQRSRDGSEFLYLKHGAWFQNNEMGMEISASVVVALPFQQGSGFMTSLAFSNRMYFWDPLGLNIAFRPLDIAFLPTQNGPGGHRGDFGFVGAGFDVGLSVKAAPLQFDLAAFVTGYYTASASTAGGYLDLNLEILSTRYYFLQLCGRGGVARFPRVVSISGNERMPQGGAVHPFIGVGLALVFHSSLLRSSTATTYTE